MAVGLLTRPSKHRLTDPEGGPDRWVTADPLLDQLRQAVGSSLPGGSFTTSNGTPLLISAQAFDLETEIRLEVCKRWAELRRLHHGQGRESIAGKLRAWAMAAESDEILTRQAERSCSRWVSQIQALFYPLRRREIRAACPVCKVARVIDHYDEEGGMVTAPALVIEYDRDGIPGAAVCRHCLTQWENHALLGLELNGAEA